MSGDKIHRAAEGEEKTEPRQMVLVPAQCPKIRSSLTAMSWPLQFLQVNIPERISESSTVVSGLRIHDSCLRSSISTRLPHSPCRQRPLAQHLPTCRHRLTTADAHPLSLYNCEHSEYLRLKGEMPGQTSTKCICTTPQCHTANAAHCSTFRRLA